LVFDFLQPIISWPREKLTSTQTLYGMIAKMSHDTLERSAYVRCVSS
jgi:hypothetical protein